MNNFKIIKYELYHGETLEIINQILKDHGCEAANASFEMEFDYGGCFYEGDSPDTRINLVMKIPKTPEELEKEELKLKKVVDLIKAKPIKRNKRNEI